MKQNGMFRLQVAAMEDLAAFHENAKRYHAVAPKPIDSPQEYRLFVNYIFKEPGTPLRNTQVIPSEWIKRASPERRKLFQREAYSQA